MCKKKNKRGWDKQKNKKGGGEKRKMKKKDRRDEGEKVSENMCVRCSNISPDVEDDTEGRFVLTEGAGDGLVMGTYLGVTSAKVVELILEIAIPLLSFKDSKKSPLPKEYLSCDITSDGVKPHVTFTV